MSEPSVLIAGTCDTKGEELAFVRGIVREAGAHARIVDLSTGWTGSSEGDVGAAEVARHHPEGAGAVFGADRGTSVAAMSQAFARYVQACGDPFHAIVALGGSGGTAIATAGMRVLPVGFPKLMVSTVAAGPTGEYVGASDIAMMYSVTDLAGLNRISRVVLANAARASAAMAIGRAGAQEDVEARPAVGLTMFGVTTPLVEALSATLSAEFDPLVFHATGTGGRSMERLVDSGLLAGVIDATTTEICDLVCGGIFPAHEDRFGAVERTGVPYVGSCGALDMVNFSGLGGVPERYRGRRLYEHNPQVALMRTDAVECARIGRWIGERLDRCAGPLAFLIPEGGVSALDAPDRPFHDPAANEALFAAIETSLRPMPRRRVQRLPFHINDPKFAEAMAAAFRSLMREV